GGPRFVNDTRLVQVAYAEALRLLHDVTAHLDPHKPVPLPALPFPGEVIGSSASSSGVSALLHALGDALGETADRRPVPGLAQLTDFVTRPGERLFARVHALDSAPIIYLAGQPDNYLDGQHLLEH